MTQKQMVDVQGKVLNALQKYPEARNNDMYLYLKVAAMIDEEFNQIRTSAKRFEDVVLNLDKYHLPSFESVSRARRKMQEKHPELKGTEKVQAKRSELEEEYKAYYSRT